MNGSNAIVRLAHIWSEMFRIVATLSMSVLATFHGSVSARYLFPNLARFIASLSASLNLKFSRLSSMFFRITGISERTSSSYGVVLIVAGTSPPKYLWVRTTALLTKFPKIATSSLLFLVWKSFHVKSLSFVSGAFAHKT